MEERTKVQIKGIREGLLITIYDEDWSEAKTNLQEQVKEQAEFLQGARLILDVGSHVIHAAELGQLQDQ